MRIKAVSAAVLIAFSPFIAHSMDDEASTHIPRSRAPAYANEGTSYQQQSYGNKPVSFEPSVFSSQGCEPSDFSTQGFEAPVRNEPPQLQLKSEQLSSLQHNPPSTADFR